MTTLATTTAACRSRKTEGGAMAGIKTTTVRAVPVR